MSLVRDVVLGMSGFLEFEFYCNRGYTFNERGLTSQIIQLVHGAENVVEFECEKSHAVLATHSSPGRPKSIDIYWHNATCDNWIEYKWFGFSQPDLTSVLKDIYRLALISATTPGGVTRVTPVL
jgi:hypothetical protein